MQFFIGMNTHYFKGNINYLKFIETIEKSEGNTVAISKDLIPITTSTFHLGKSIRLIGPDRKWVFDAWRVTTIDTLGLVPCYTTSSVPASEYIVLKGVFNIDTDDNDYSIEITGDPKQLMLDMYYIIPVPYGYDTMVWSESTNDVIITEMSFATEYNRNYMILGKEEIYPVIVEETREVREYDTLYTLTSTVSSVTTEHEHGIIILPSSNEKLYKMLKPNIYKMSDKLENWDGRDSTFPGSKKYEAYTSDSLIVIPPREHATSGWFKWNAYSNPGKNNKKSVTFKELKETTIRVSRSTEDHIADEKVTKAIYYLPSKTRTITEINNQPVETYREPAVTLWIADIFQNRFSYPIE